MTKTIKIMSSDAIRVAIEQYGDATAYIQILQANQLDDWFLNQPVSASASASAPAGSSTLVFPPLTGINFNDFVYSDAIDHYSVVTSITQTYQQPAGAPFCVCHVVGEPTRLLPNLGQWLSTSVTIAPPLTRTLNIGETVTFAVGTPQRLVIPPAPPASNGGVPI
jgi:hypothetical protein